MKRNYHKEVGKRFMKGKKTNSILVAAILLVTLTITAMPTMAADLHDVYGYLYINDVIAPSDVEVRLTFYDDPEEIIDFTDSNGFYSIGFEGHNWEEGFLSVYSDGNWQVPIDNQSVEIEEDEIGYEMDLHIDISNNPPNAPSNPNPSNGATGVNFNKDISWACTDPDGDPLTFDIYFGTNSDPLLIKEDHGSKSFNQGSMSYITKYYWKIVARDDKGATAEGPIWSFTVQEESSGGGGESGGGGGGPINIAPVADATLSETTGIVGVSVDFDGSESYDSDGSITTYSWAFGDGETGSGVTTSHTFDSEGVYSVTLTVTDNIGAVDSTTFDVTVAAKPNTPPDAPIISGTKMGTKDESYDYTFLSIDDDGDDLQYIIEWSDESTSTTDFYPNATEATEPHSFGMAGVYVISAYAYDNETASGTTEFEVLIDAWWVKEIGLLLDEDANGVYEKFLSNSTGELTDSEQNDDGKYLIDEDGDGKWDWVYDKETDTLTPYSEGEEEEADYTMWYALIILIIIILIILGYLAGRKKKKPEPQKPVPKKDTGNNPGKNPGKKTTPKKK